MPPEDPNQPAPPFVLLRRYEDEYVAYAWQNVDVILWTGAATGAGARTMNQLTRQRMQQGVMHSAVHVSLPSSGLPDAEAREEFAALAKRWSKSLGCLVSVIEREGFVGSALRGFTTGIYALTSKGTTHKVVQTVEEAAAWMPGPHARATGVQLDPEELRRVFVAMRASV